MIELIIFIFLSISITNIVVFEHIFDFLHRFIDKYMSKTMIHTLFNCPTCLGFWVGAGLFWFFPIQYEWSFLTILVAGFISSISNKLFNLLRY